MNLTDTHCHLNHSDFSDDWRAALGRARDSGVGRLLVIGFDLASSRLAVEIASSEPDIQAVIGIHPESATEWNDNARAELVALVEANRPKVAAWGEVGLDYHWDSVSREAQSDVFVQQIAAAASLDLPLVIHCRDAYTDVIDLLIANGAHRAVLHCFTGTQAEAERAITAGYYIGVGGIATFKKNDTLRDILQNLPLNRLLLETDSPYLAPQARRGKRNEPSYVALIAEALAPLWSLNADELAAATTANAVQLFGVMG